jgi:hypothetical protein
MNLFMSGSVVYKRDMTNCQPLNVKTMLLFRSVVLITVKHEV